MATVYTSPKFPQHCVVEHADEWFLVPSRSGGWDERVPYKGAKRGLVPLLEEAQASQLATLGYRPRSGAAARSGPNVSNAQRGTEQVLLRCPPGIKARLAALAERDGVTMGAWLAAAVEEAEGKSTG